MPNPTDETIKAWTTLMSVSRLLLEAVEADLKAAGRPPLSWYDMLLEIEKAGDGGMRPFQLKDRLLLPQYGTSRLLDRLIAAGLIEKRACADDGRGYAVAITPEGRRERRRMWPIYAAALERLIETLLDGAERTALAALLGKLRADAPTPPDHG